MFQALKRLFRREESGAAPASPAPQRPPPPPSAKPPAGRQGAPAPPPGRQAPTPGAQPAPLPQADAATGQTVRVSLTGIVAGLPAALKGKVRLAGSANVQVAIPLPRLIPQLAQGRVQISFAEFRECAPQGVVAAAGEQDKVMIDLPLPEILAQVPPHLLPRRQAQRRVEIPDEVAPVFGQKDSAAKVAPHRPGARAPTSPAPAPVPAPVPSPYRPPSPAAPHPPATAAPAQTPGSIQLKQGDLELLAKARGAAPKSAPAPARPPAPPAPTPAPAAHLPPAPAPSATGTVTVPVVQVLAAMPDVVRSALTQINNPEAAFVLPAAEVEKGLKSGKVAFSWKLLRSCLRPGLVTSTTPSADQLQISLPLSVVAPLFLASHRPTAPQRKVSIGEGIPDVFTPGRAGAHAAPTVDAPAIAARAPSAPTAPAPVPGAPRPIPARSPAAPSIPIPVPAARPPAPVVPAAPVGDIGELFGQPGRKSWTPAEIVHKTSQLGGVGGALIILHDGLLVAAHLPPGLNGETIAAFLPQMYSRMAQYCKELKFGEPRKLTFVIENLPLKVYRGAGLFFIILGRAGEVLPDGHLDVIAEQLGSQSK